MQRLYHCTVNVDIPSRLLSEDFRAAPRHLQQVSSWHPVFNMQSKGSWGCAVGADAVSQTDCV